jgi:hypothetical protein
MAGVSGGGTLPRLALARVSGKPYTVTEYNHPAPNTYSSEAFLLLAAYAALQDWDGIFAFDYSGFAQNWDARKITGFFAIDQHPTKLVTLPAVAALFRRADVRSPGDPLTVNIPLEAMLKQLSGPRPWISADQFGVPLQTAFQRPVAVETGEAPLPAPSAAAPWPPVVASATGELTWSSAPQDQVVTVNTPRSKAVIGSTGRGSFPLGDVLVTAGATRQHWMALTLTVLEGQDFATARRLLVTATGYVENTDMGWKNAEKSTVGPDWGQAPSLVEGVAATVELPLPADRVHAWALDERGQHREDIPVGRGAQGHAVLRLGPEHQTLWYEVTSP